MSSTTQPSRQYFPQFNLSPEEIGQQTDQAIANLTQVADKLGQIPLENCTFDNVVRYWAEQCAHVELDMDVICFLQHVSTCDEVREASRQAESKWNEFAISLSQREDHYLRFKQVAETEDSSSNLDQVDRRLLEHSLRAYRRKGLELDEETREQLKQLLNRQQELGILFSKTIGEDKSCLYCTSEELKGVADDFLTRTAKSAKDEALNQAEKSDETPSGKFDGRHKITAQYPDVFPILEFCQVAETRKRVALMFEARAESNLSVLRELLQLRQQVADLLGYANNVAYQTEVLMTKTQKRTEEFLNQILEKLTPSCQKYVAELTALKQTDLGTEEQVTLEYWDYAYYHQKYLQDNHQLDHQKLKEYFPTNYVCDQMFKIYCEIFQLEINELTPPQKWHETVRYFEVIDTVSGQMMGHFYMDLYPREGKYSHAAAWSMIGYQTQKPDSDEREQVLPFGCLVCNFTAPTEDRPSMLTYNQVNTFFHEFGHIIHGISGGFRNRYSDFSGTNVERDFVEAPSQMIEQWMWEPIVLKRISCHFQSEETIPEDLLNNLLASRYVGKAKDWTRQAVLSLVDHQLHLKGDWQSDDEMLACYCEISNKYMGYPCGNGKHLASWGHMGGGYDARYYSYIWSRVIACDLYSRFEDSGDPLNKDVGLAYRQKVLEPGGSLDGLDMVKNYLGREMKLEPFLRSMGV